MTRAIRHRLACGENDTWAEQRLCRLRVMATSDLHMQLLGYDYLGDRSADGPSLVAIARLIGELRAEGGDSLLFDNGDVLQGNPLGDYIARQNPPGPDRLHPAIAAMNALGYDAATPGNHDFNYGVDFLLDAIEGANFPFVATNIGLNGNTKRSGLLHQTLVLERRLTDVSGREHALRIGVIGVLPPETMRWDRRHLGGRGKISGIVAAARYAVTRLRKVQGCDLVVALAHTGIGPRAAGDSGERAATALAAVRGIDAVIAGHSHLVFPSPHFRAEPGVDPIAGRIAGKPAVMPGSHGSHLGLIDFNLQPDGAGGWHILSARAEARPVPMTTGAPPRSATDLADRITAIATPDHAETLRLMRRPLGHTQRALNSFFSLVAPDPALTLIAEAKCRYLREHLAAARSLPVLAAVSPFRAGGRGGPGYYTDVARGELTLRSIADLYAYPNAITALRINGAELHEWLERSASAFNRIAPGTADQLLLNPDFPAYNFDVVTGVEYDIDLSSPARYDPRGRLCDPAARRVHHLRRQGRDVAPGDWFILATSSYRAAVAPVSPAQVVYDGEDCARDILARHVETYRTVDPCPSPHWRFSPVAGASVLFDTSPEAHAHLEGLDLRIEAAGDGPGGFARFRIHL